jgi:hypothetical protein
MTAGTFAEWQPQYAERGIATFPVLGKKPAVSGYLKIGLKASQQFASKFASENAFGLACRRNRITVLDVDAPDERLLADAMSEYGETPFVVRSGSGNFQAWYRHDGESRRVRPDHRPIDILGDGFVVAPPSVGSRNSYRIISGSLDDLVSLPPMRRLETATRSRGAVEERVETGKRNETLWRLCMSRARHCSGIDELIEIAKRENAELFYEPLPTAEVLKAVASAWAKETAGENWIGRGKRVVVDFAEVDGLLQNHPDAFALLMILRRYHRIGETFVVANAMAERMPSGGWTVKRFAAARRRLEEIGEIVMIHPPSRQHGPARYRFKSGQI